MNKKLIESIKKRFKRLSETSWFELHKDLYYFKKYKYYESGFTDKDKDGNLIFVYKIECADDPPKALPLFAFKVIFNGFTEEQVMEDDSFFESPMDKLLNRIVTHVAFKTLENQK